MNITKMPNEIDSPALLLGDLKKLRDLALEQGDMEYTVHLSHCYAWLKWLSDNYMELTELQRMSIGDESN